MPKILHQNRLLDLVASPFFLALPLTIVLILFLPNTALRYKVALDHNERIGKNNALFSFYDLNHNGADEQIVAYPNVGNKEAAIKILDYDECNYEQWNFPGYFSPGPHLYFTVNLNHNRYADIFLFYYRSDSVFMGAIQPYPDKKVLFTDRFVTKIRRRNGKIDFILSKLIVADMNRDGYDDLVFSLSAGYSKQPREIFIYDIHNNTLIHSKSTGAKFGTFYVINRKEDPYPEIFCATSASGNIDDSIRFPYNDYSSWLMGFDHNLQFLFQPIRLNRYPMSSRIEIYTNKAGACFIMSSSYHYNKKELYLTTFRPNGKVYAQKILPVAYKVTKKGEIYFTPVQYRHHSYILLGRLGNRLVLTDEKFHFKYIKTRSKFANLAFTGDLNGDGKKEYVFTSGFDNNFEITNHLFRLMARFTAKNLSGNFETQMGIIRLPHNKRMLYIGRPNNILHIYSYTKNPMYYLKYPLWLLLYGLVVLILWFTQRMQHLQIKRKQEIENTINTLQLKTIKSQMDPHFMFNVLNGLANNVAMGNKQESYTQIVRFSHLLRAMMKRTDSIDIRLGGEIDFVRNYLELEKFRFKGDFEYKIILDNNVDENNRIPRMLIQLLVENAIKHGLRDKTGQKKLTVHVFLRNGKTVVTVDDNGIGRTAAAQKRSTGKGYKLIKDMIRLYRKMGGHNIKVTTIDKYDDTDNPTGTLVEVEISNGESSDAE